MNKFRRIYISSPKQIVFLGVLFIFLHTMIGCSRGCYINPATLSEAQFLPENVQEVSRFSLESIDAAEGGKFGPSLHRMLGTDLISPTIIEQLSQYLEAQGWKITPSVSSDTVTWYRENITIQIAVVGSDFGYIPDTAPAYETWISIWIYEAWNEDSCP